MKKRCILSIMAILSLFCFISCSKLPELPGLTGNDNAWKITYNGVAYTGKDFFCADEDKQLLGRADNGARVYAIGNTDDPIYMVIEGNDNTGCYIKEGYSVPTSGTVTKVLVDPAVRSKNTCVLAAQEELDMVSELTGYRGETQEFSIDNVYIQGNRFYYVYDGSNVATTENYGGYIAYINGTWIYAAPGNKLEQKENNAAIVEAVILDDAALINKICQTNLVAFIER